MRRVVAVTEVYRRDFYEWPFNHDEADCEDCGEVMDVPEMDDQNRDMKQPFWLRFNNVFKSFCEGCWSDRVFQDDTNTFTETDTT